MSATSPEPRDAAPGTDTAQPAKRRGLVEIIGERRQNRGATGVKAAAASPRTAKEVVDGLDQWELRLAIAAAVVQAALTPVLYFYWRTHGDVAVRNAAADFLITGIVSTVIIALGVVFKRRALVGFAAFMTGMAWLTYGNLFLAVVYLFFGGWLIMRVMRKQKQDRAAGKVPASRSGRAAAAKPPTGRPAPKASKRYTPPRRAATRSRAASSGRRAAQGPRR